MQFPVIHYGMAIYKRQYTDKTLTLKHSMYMRASGASGASELRKFSNFYILKLLFLSIFCWYFRYFVGTNDMLVGLHVPTKLRKSMVGQRHHVFSCLGNVRLTQVIPGNQLVTLSTN